MTSFKTIAAAAIIAVAGTVAAFSGLHLGQPGARAATTAQATAQAAKAKATYRVNLTAKQLAQLMRGQRQNHTYASHRVRSAHRRRQATHRRTNAGASYRSHSRSSSYSRQSGSRGSYRCYDYGHSNSGRGGSGGSRSGGRGSGCNCW